MRLLLGRYLDMQGDDRSGRGSGLPGTGIHCNAGMNSLRVRFPRWIGYAEPANRQVVPYPSILDILMEMPNMPC